MTRSLEISIAENHLGLIPLSLGKGKQLHSFGLMWLQSTVIVTYLGFLRMVCIALLAHFLVPFTLKVYLSGKKNIWSSYINIMNRNEEGTEIVKTKICRITQWGIVNFDALLLNFCNFIGLIILSWHIDTEFELNWSKLLILYTWDSWNK